MLVNNYGGANSITVRLEYINSKGMLAKILKKISDVNGDMAGIDVISIKGKDIVRDLTINAVDSNHEEKILETLRKLKNVKVLNVSDQTFLMHLGICQLLTEMAKQNLYNIGYQEIHIFLILIVLRI